MKGRRQGWIKVPRPQPGELISSWLHRLAIANGKSDQSFITTMLGTSAQIWTRDIDRTLPRRFIKPLADWTGQSVPRIRAMTLAALQLRVSGSIVPRGVSAWVLPLGVFHRVRRRSGVQFCPACLRERPAFVPASWRLAFVTVCLKHNVKLHDRCPACGGCFMFHRMRPDAAGRWVCCHCRYDLGRAKRETPKSDLVRLQERLERAAGSGWSRLQGRWHMGWVLFRGVRFLVRALLSGRLIDLRREASKASPDLMNALPRVQFERQSIEVRRAALEVVARWLKTWPTQFLNDMAASRSYRSFLLADEALPAFWVQQALDELPTAQPHVLTRVEAEAACAWIQSQGQAVNAATLASALGLTVWEARHCSNLPILAKVIGAAQLGPG